MKIIKRSELFPRHRKKRQKGRQQDGEVVIFRDYFKTSDKQIIKTLTQEYEQFCNLDTNPHCTTSFSSSSTTSSSSSSSSSSSNQNSNKPLIDGIFSMLIDLKELYLIPSSTSKDRNDQRYKTCFGGVTRYSFYAVNELDCCKSSEECQESHSIKVVMTGLRNIEITVVRTYVPTFHLQSWVTQHRMTLHKVMSSMVQDPIGRLGVFRRLKEYIQTNHPNQGEAFTRSQLGYIDIHELGTSVFVWTSFANSLILFAYDFIPLNVFFNDEYHHRFDPIQLTSHFIHPLFDSFYSFIGGLAYIIIYTRLETRRKLATELLHRHLGRVWRLLCRRSLLSNLDVLSSAS